MAEFSVGYAGIITIEAEDADAAAAKVGSFYGLTPLKPGTEREGRLMVCYAMPTLEDIRRRAEAVN